MGLGQNLLDTPTLRSGAYVSPNVTAHAPTGIAVTDTANLTQAIGDTPEGGWLFLPNGGDTSYALETSLSITKSMRVTGGGVTPLWGSHNQGFDTQNVPSVSPYLMGTVLEVVAPGVDAIDIPAIGATVNLEDFGILFGASGGQFTNTGHGINATPTANGLPNGLDNGILGQFWKNVHVFGHDGSHYGFVITNSLYGTMEHCRSYGGGTLSLICNGYNNGTTVSFYGGMVVSHLFGNTFVGGSAHGIHINNIAGHINGILWNRPQIWVMSADTFPGVTAPTSAQLLFHVEGAYGDSPYMSFMQQDWETNVNSAFDTPVSGVRNFDWAGINPGTNEGSYFGLQDIFVNNYEIYLPAVQSAGTAFYTLNDASAGQLEGYFQDGSRQKISPKIVIQAPPITATAGTNAGTAPPAPVVTDCNDARGRITFGTGTSPTAGDQVDVTFGQAWTAAAGAVPTVVITPANAVTASLGLYVSTSSLTGFSVSCQNAPAASQGNTVYAFTYMVVA